MLFQYFGFLVFFKLSYILQYGFFFVLFTDSHIQYLWVSRLSFLVLPSLWRYFSVML